MEYGLALIFKQPQDTQYIYHYKRNHWSEMCLQNKTTKGVEISRDGSTTELTLAIILTKNEIIYIVNP